MDGCASWRNYSIFRKFMTMKKEFVYICLLLFISINCISQNQDGTINNSPTYTVYIESSKENFIQVHLDSILNTTRDRDIPNFLMDECFDYHFRAYSNSIHNPESLRQKIIVSIKDKEILEFLLSKKEHISDEICGRKLEEPYGSATYSMDSQEYSNLDLIRMRLDE